MPFYLWLAAGCILAGLEMIIPGFVLIWFGVAALLVGGLTFLVPDLAWGVQTGLFAGLSAILFFVSRHFFPGRAQDDQASLINDRARAMIGQVLTLSEPIRHGQGKIFINATLWRIKGPDANTGDVVEVTGVEGDQLVVTLK